MSSDEQKNQTMDRYHISMMSLQDDCLTEIIDLETGEIKLPATPDDVKKCEEILIQYGNAIRSIERQINYAKSERDMQIQVIESNFNSKASILKSRMNSIVTMCKPFFDNLGRKQLEIEKAGKWIYRKKQSTAAANDHWKDMSDDEKADLATLYPDVIKIVISYKTVINAFKTMVESKAGDVDKLKTIIDYHPSTEFFDFKSV